MIIVLSQKVTQLNTKGKVIMVIFQQFNYYQSLKFILTRIQSDFFPKKNSFVKIIIFSCLNKTFFPEFFSPIF